MTAIAHTPLRQRHQALERANDIRIRRAQLKRDVRDRSARIEDVLREPEWFMFSVPVCELVSWAPRIGRVRVNRVLRRAEIWPLREVGMLTLRQRERLILELSAGWGR